MSKKKLFISYVEKDKALVKAVVELLKAGTTLNDADLEYSSLTRQGSPDSEGLSAYIQKQIKTPAAAILLLTPNYFANRYGLCEMGAVLALSQNTLPLLVPPLTHKHVQGVFPASELDTIDNTDDLNKFVAKLQRALDLGELNLQQWAMKKKQFLAAVPLLLNQH